MTQEEQIYRQDRRMAGAGVAAGLLVTFLGLVELWRNGLNPSFISTVTGAMTAFYLFLRYRTLTKKIELEQNRS